MSGFFAFMQKTAGVKSAKLCVEQDQIGKRLSQAMTSFRVDRKDECSPPSVVTGLAEEDRIRLTANFLDNRLVSPPIKVYT